jgi:hypothetical protein
MKVKCFYRIPEIIAMPMRGNGYNAEDHSETKRAFNAAWNFLRDYDASGFECLCRGSKPQPNSKPQPKLDSPSHPN